MKNAIKSHAGITILMVALILVISGLSWINSYGQGLSMSGSVMGAVNASAKIRYTSHINHEAKSTPLNASINSPYVELKPAFAPQGDKLYFSRSFHPDNTGGIADKEDIWYTQYDSVTDLWSQPIRMTGYLNNAGPNYIENVSMSGDTLILGNRYLKNGKMRDGLSYTVNMNGVWSDPIPIIVQGDYNISTHANHFVSLKTGVIILAVQRDESFGERDLYVSFWNGVNATVPVNMGGIINSADEESSPYLSCDNKTLYFASKGHNGMGGYDIFVTHRLDDSWTNWSVPENLGPAVNGPLDDEFFSITHCGRFGVFTKQVNVHNVDLFRIPCKDLFGAPAPSDIAPARRQRMTMGKL